MRQTDGRTDTTGRHRPRYAEHWAAKTVPTSTFTAGLRSRALNAHIVPEFVAPVFKQIDGWCWGRSFQLSMTRWLKKCSQMFNLTLDLYDFILWHSIKSQIAHSDMHHPVSGINSLIHSVSLASHVLTHVLIHLSAHLYYHPHFRHPSLLHSFTAGSKPTFSTNPSYLRHILPTGLPSWQRDWAVCDFICSSFIFSFTF